MVYINFFLRCLSPQLPRNSGSNSQLSFVLLGRTGCERMRTHARIPTVRVGSSRNQAFTRWEIVLREEGDLLVNARLYLRYGAFIVEECVRYTQKVLLTSYVAGVPFYHIRILLLRLQVFYL